MNNLTQQQMLELAEIVYPGQPAKIDYEYDEYLVLFGGDLQEFKPSLTGEDWQKAQALDVIVAADKLDGCFRCKSSSEDDLLTAASLALISGGRS